VESFFPFHVFFLFSRGGANDRSGAVVFCNPNPLFFSPFLNARSEKLGLTLRSDILSFLPPSLSWATYGSDRGRRWLAIEGSYPVCPCKKMKPTCPRPCGRYSFFFFFFFPGNARPQDIPVLFWSGSPNDYSSSFLLYWLGIISIRSNFTRGPGTFPSFPIVSPVFVLEVF